MLFEWLVSKEKNIPAYCLPRSSCDSSFAQVGKSPLPYCHVLVAINTTEFPLHYSYQCKEPWCNLRRRKKGLKRAKNTFIPYTTRKLVNFPPCVGQVWHMNSAHCYVPPRNLIGRELERGKFARAIKWRRQPKRAPTGSAYISLTRRKIFTEYIFLLYIKINGKLDEGKCKI